MPLATKNGAIILKDGKLAEDCGCCGGWYCFLDPTSDPSAPCCSSQALSLVMNFVASPQLAGVRFGEDPEAALRARFPVSISKTVTLQKSGETFLFSSGFNYFGVEEAGFSVVVAIPKTGGVCKCNLQVTELYFKWKWDKQASAFSPGDSREPAGFQYADLVFQASKLSSTFDVGQTPCFPATTLSTADRTVPGFGSASGTVTLSPA